MEMLHAVPRWVSVMWVKTTSLFMRLFMSSLRLSPVRSVLQRKMANGGGGSSEYESFEEEEEEEPRPPPTPPPAIPRSKGAVKSAAPTGTARSCALRRCQGRGSFLAFHLPSACAARGA